MAQQVPFAWRLFTFLGQQRGLLYGSLAVVVLVAAYRLMTQRPLFGGLFEFALGLPAGGASLYVEQSATARHCHHRSHGGTLGWLGVLATIARLQGGSRTCPCTR